MPEGWFTIDGGTAAAVALSALGALAATIVLIRITGLRSLSKMSSFDFVVTIAIGSIIATTATSSTSLPTGALAVAVLLATQWTVSTLRRRAGFDRVVDNRPLLLMRGSRMLDGNLTRARVTTDDVVAKLREANVTDLDQVLAVVLETTGDVSVLHGTGPLDERLLDGVAGTEVRRARG